MLHKERRVVNEDDKLVKALSSLPTPEPRPGFVDEALTKATGAALPPERSAEHRRALTRPETWFAAITGAAVAAALTWFMLRPLPPDTAHEGIALTINESRNIEVLIESERELKDATIRVTLTGGVILDGFDDERHIDWQADVDPGINVLSLPVVARRVGAGHLVAVVEHGGKTRRVTVNLKVNAAPATQS